MRFGSQETGRGCVTESTAKPQFGRRARIGAPGRKPGDMPTHGVRGLAPAALNGSGTFRLNCYRPTGRSSGDFA